MKPSEFFTQEEKDNIKKAVQEAELNTSGEIRVHIETNCKTEVLDRAAFIFDKLDMQKTASRNGVLFYLAIEDRKFAILGDAGINAKVPENFWDTTKDLMLEKFKANEFASGLIQGILKAGEKLKEHFPYQKNDVNELSDEISFKN